jgi:hypothetical protein
MHLSALPEHIEKKENDSLSKNVFFFVLGGV